MLSLVVPSHRPDSLKRKLESLTKQSLPLSKLEVLVVVLESEQARLSALGQGWPFQLRFVVIPEAVVTKQKVNNIAALKRNWGMKAAQYDPCMLTDDDVFHSDGGLNIFTDFFAGGFRGIATCDLRFENQTVFRLGAKASPVTDVRWVQFSTSLVVLDKESFARVGPFKEDFVGRGEDIEYGYRAHRLGVPIKRLAGDWAIHEGAPRNDFATGKTSGYGAYVSAKAYGQAYALALGVHPLSIGLKSLAFRLGLSRLFTTSYYKEYEQGYLAGALEAKREVG